MDIYQQRDLLHFLKALSQEHRLMMISMMSEREYTVKEMAGLLELSEPTVSHHVSKLHGVGLLNQRMAGNQRFYKVNPNRMKQLKGYMAVLDTPLVLADPEVSDNTWIEELDFDAADKKILRDVTFSGKLKRPPRKEKKLLVVLRWLATLFDDGRRYTEKEVNEILTEVYVDYATLRRDLVEFGFMRREKGGGDYWLTPDDE